MFQIKCISVDRILKIKIIFHWCLLIIFVFYQKIHALKHHTRDFPGGPVVKTSPSNAAGVGLIPGPGAKIPHASGPKNQHIKQKQYCNKFNKDLNFFFKKKKIIITQKRWPNSSCFIIHNDVLFLCFCHF